MARGTKTGTVTMPDGTVLTYQYQGGMSTSRGKREEEENRRKAEDRAIADYEQQYGREMFYDSMQQDYLAGLEEFLPNYDELLNRQGTTFEDIAGTSSREAAAASQGAKSFRDIYDQGGYTEAERGQIEQSLMQARAGEKSQRDAVQQQMQARGMAGSGLEAMGAIGAQQAGANQGLQASTDIATQAQQRALQSLAQGTQFGAQAGKAADEFNKAHLGWQDYQQQMQGQWQQQALQNQTELRRLQQENAYRRAAMGQALASGAEIQDSSLTPADYGSAVAEGAASGMRAYSSGS